MLAPLNRLILHVLSLPHDFTSKVRRLHLVVTKGDYSRDDLATLLWPESDQSSARANLRRTLYLTNRTLGERILTTGADTIRLDLKAEIWTDVVLFQQHLRECSPQGESQENITVRCLSVLEEAVALYKADLLAGFTLPDCLSFNGPSNMPVAGSRWIPFTSLPINCS
jgi:two-component SAPR family response regulator